MRPISKNSLLSYTKNGTTYYVKILEFMNDWGLYPEWSHSLYAPGRVLIEFIGSPWDPHKKFVRKTDIVDTRYLTIIPGTT